MRVLLIVEEDVRFQCFQNPSFVHAAEEVGFIDGDVPAAQGVDDPAVGRGTAGGDDGGFEEAIVSWIALFSFIFKCPQISQFAEEITQGPGGNGVLSVGGF